MKKKTKAMPGKLRGPIAEDRAEQLDAAYQVLKAKGGPMTYLAIVQAMLEAKMWSNMEIDPATALYRAILREIRTKGSTSRFRKTAPYQFAAA